MTTPTSPTDRHHPSAHDLGLRNGVDDSCVHGRSVWACTECGVNRGMTVDGDVLRDLICDSVPRLIADDAAERIAEDTLDAAVRAGMTVLHGPDGTPRTVAERRAEPS